jgi:putative ABC transport system permease protein
MNVFSRGIRNAFRNQVRTIAVVGILSLSIGLSLAMLVAHKAVDQKINSVKASAGNTITISPAGFSNFSQVNNALTTALLSKVSGLAHVTSLTETLTDRLKTIGSASASSFGASSTSSNQTSLTSPVTINANSKRGLRAFTFGGLSGIPSNFSPPITITGTNNPYSLNSNNLSLSSGNFINGNLDNNQALVSTSMASKNNLKVGSTFTAYSATLTVAGIFSNNGNQSLGNNLIVSLPTEQSLSGQSGAVTSALATVDSEDNLASVTAAVKNVLGSSADVESAQDIANQTIQPLDSVSSVSMYSLVGAVVAGAVIILMIMIMITRERRREIGVLKAIGASNLKVVTQFVSEAVTFAVMAAVVGIIIGVAAASPITNTLVKNSSTSSTSTNFNGGFRTNARFGAANGPTLLSGGRGLGKVRNEISNVKAEVGWSIIGYGFGAAIIIAVAGSSIAAWFIAKVRPAEVMRME